MSISIAMSECCCLNQNNEILIKTFFMNIVAIHSVLSVNFKKPTKYVSNPNWNKIINLKAQHYIEKDHTKRTDNIP